LDRRALGKPGKVKAACPKEDRKDERGNRC
jgi:hypothetical protein